MPPSRIMFIRHAEKPADGSTDGIASDGTEDVESLTARGWRRAEKLAQFFVRSDDLTPGIVFASKVGPHSHSRRPIETVTPLVQALVRRGTPARLDATHLKDEVVPLMGAVVSGDQTTLVCWEHKTIPRLCGLLPNAPPSPQTWPDDRFDIVWIFDRTADGWSFSQKPQLLLDGDRPDPIDQPGPTP